MSRYAKQFNTKKTLQTEAIPGSNQVANSAGGFSWEVDDWKKLERFLILGTEGGSYYASEREMTRKNAEAVERCIKADGNRTVRTIVDISTSGRAPKNDPAIFALAMAAKLGDDATRSYALAAVSLVCRIGTHLFQFVEAMQSFGGWGRGTKRAIADWYKSKSPELLAYQLVKYRQRNGWSHKDTLLLAHPGRVESLPLKFAVGKLTPEDRERVVNTGGVLSAFLCAQDAGTEKEIVRIISGTPSLPWEAIPDKFLKSAEVWKVLLPNMPMTAMVRNLARMTANGAITPMSESVKTVLDHLRNTEKVQKSRIHPIQVLSAMKTYASGHGVRGDLTWMPVQQIVDALNDTFYVAFGNVKPTGKRFLLGVDVSGSMSSGNIAGIPGLCPRDAAAVMAMVTARVETNYLIHGFTARFVDLGISPSQRLDDVLARVYKANFGTTDCAVPMTYATDAKLGVDLFAVYTDSETYMGRIHPSQALKEYRQKLSVPAKSVVVGIVANSFSIADPNDAGMLDVVGMDTATPNLIADFATS